MNHNRTGQLVRQTVNGRVDDEVRYDTGARAEIHTDARGFTRRMVKNEFDQIVESTRLDGITVKYAYSAVNLRLNQEINEVGLKTLYEYNSKGNLIRRIEAVGSPDERTTMFVVNGLGQTTRTTSKGRTEANGIVTQDAVISYTYDGLGRVFEVYDPEGNIVRLAYDRAGNLVNWTDARGNATVVNVNAEGQVIKLTDSLGRMLNYTYDKVGNSTGLLDFAGNRSILDFNVMNQVMQVASPLSGVLRMDYNKRGLTTSVMDADGRTSTFEYDNFQRPSKSTDATGNVASYSYQIADGSSMGVLGSLGEPTEVVYPTFTERTRFDPRGRPTSVTRVGQGITERTSNIAYNARGLVQRETNAYGKSFTSSFNDMGMPSQVVDMLGNPIQLKYDVRGNLLQVIDANNHERRYEYDRNGRVRREILHLGQTIESEYDAVGNLVKRKEANGTVQTHSYDAANRVTRTVHYTADNFIERTFNFTWGAQDELLSWSDSTAGAEASATMTYDVAGRKIAENVTYPGGFSMHYAYGYGGSGKKNMLTWPDDTVFEYGYGANGELQSVAIPNQGSISISEYKWNAPSRVTLPGGTVQNKSYDALLNLTALAVKGPSQQGLLDTAYSYGKLDELKSSTRTDQSANVTKISTYSYDDANRLTREVIDTGGILANYTETFTLDAVANRIVDSRVAGAWTYDANGRLLQRGTGTNATRYDYDDAGNLVRMSEPAGRITNYGYNAGNRLATVSDGSDQLVARYGYDPAGRRIWKEQFLDGARAMLPKPIRTYYLYSDEGLLAEASQAITSDRRPDGDAALTSQYGVSPDVKFNTGILFIKTKNSNGATCKSPRKSGRERYRLPGSEFLSLK